MKHLLVIAMAVIFSISMIAQTPVNLKLNLENGKVYKIKSSNQQTVQVTANGQQYTTDINTSNFISFKVLNQTKDMMMIEFKFDTVQLNINSPMYKKESNSAIPAKSKEYPERTMNKLSAFKFVAKISYAGKFMGFVNYKPFRDSIMALMDSVPVTKKEQVQKQVDAMIKESVLQSMIEPIFAFLPEKPVSIGEKWDRPVVQSNSSASMMSFNTYSFTGAENNIVKLSGTSDIESIPSNDASAMGTTELKGTSSTEMTVDPATGLIIKDMVKGHVEGSVNRKNQGTDIKMPLVADFKTDISLVK